MRRVGGRGMWNAQGSPTAASGSRHRLLSIGLIAVVLLASASGIVYYEAYVANSGCNSNPPQSARLAISTDCTVGLTLSLAIKETFLPIGKNQSFFLSVKN